MIARKAPRPELCPDSESGVLRAQPAPFPRTLGGSIPMRPHAANSATCACHYGRRSGECGELATGAGFCKVNKHARKRITKRLSNAQSLAEVAKP